MPLITAIEFTENECRLLQADQARGRLAVREAFSFHLPGEEDVAKRPETWAARLRETLRARKVKAGPVRVLIPKSAVMARMVTLPANEDSEVAGMARFEAERHIPFNAERHVIGHHILARHGVQGCQVLLAAVDDPVAREYLETCVRAGLTVESLGVSSLAMFNALSAARSAGISDKVVALVHIGRASTDLVIANSGVMNFARSCTTGVDRLFADLAEAEPGREFGLSDLPLMDSLEPQRTFQPPAQAHVPDPSPATDLFGETTLVMHAAQPTPADAAAPDNRGAVAFKNWLLRVLQEVRRTYEYARREFNCPPIEEFHLSGEGALIRNLPQFLQANFSTPSSVLDALAGAEIPAGLSADLAGRGPVLAALAGAFASEAPQAVRINLLPPDYVQKRASKRQQQSTITSGILALALIVLVWLLVSDAFNKQDEITALLQSKNREMKDSVAELESKRQRLDIMQKYIKDSHGALTILDAISGMEMVPKDATLTRFEYRKDDEVKMQGHTRTFADINKLRNALEKTGFFASVSLDEGSNKPRVLPNRTEPVFEFFMTAKFAKRAVKKGKAAAGATAARAETKVNKTEEATDGAN